MIHPIREQELEEVDPPERTSAVRLEPAGDRLLITPGPPGANQSGAVAEAVRELDPLTHPRLTLDLRECETTDPVVVHALLRAWERRDRAFGSIRVLTRPGPAERFLLALRLEHALDIQRDQAVRQPMRGDPGWVNARLGTVGHYHQLLAAAQQQDLARFETLAAAAHPVCVEAGAHPQGHAVGPWCTECRLAARYGGCRPLLDHMIRAARTGNWEAAQLLVLTLIAETVGGD